MTEGSIRLEGIREEVEILRDCWGIPHIRAANDHKDRPDLTADLWRAHAALVDGVAVPFLHSEMTGAAASALIAPILSQRMAACEAVPA